jgi:hypothetical protein
MSKKKENTNHAYAVICPTCGLRKKPIGRDAAPVIANSYCGPDCPGYYKDPWPGTLWPDEIEEQSKPTERRQGDE